MGKAYLSPGAFDPQDIVLFRTVYDAVCQRITEDGAIILTTQVRETIAACIFDAALGGERSPEELWCRAMREVRLFHGVQQSLERIATQAASESPPRSRT
jgi:hypothetical protein